MKVKEKLSNWWNKHGDTVVRIGQVGTALGGAYILSKMERKHGYIEGYGCGRVEGITEGLYSANYDRQEGGEVAFFNDGSMVTPEEYIETVRDEDYIVQCAISAEKEGRTRFNTDRTWDKMVEINRQNRDDAVFGD